MKIFYKQIQRVRSSMISPKYRHISQKKIDRNRMSYLIKDLERSKIAVENITKFGGVQEKYKQQIQDVQQDLQLCIMSISMENKKQRVLGQLICILKNQMIDYQNIKKKEEEAEEMKKDKMIGKCQYQIDQILQKHNEQIAKIHNLKDMANSNRSERVVYSSLFKKLQKQIKHYQQIYKEQLMQSRYMSSAPRNNLSDVRVLTTNSHREQNISQQKSREQIPKLKKQKTSIKQQSEPWKGFVTVSKEEPEITTRQQKKFHSTFEEDQMSRLTINREEKFAYTKELLRQIAEYNNFIDKLKVYAECCHVEEMIKYYSTIEEENKVMLAKIMQQDKRIESISQITRETLKRAEEEDTATKITELEQLQMQNDPNYNKSFLVFSKVTEDNQYLTHKFDAIAKIIFQQQDSDQEMALGQQQLRLINERVQQICKLSDNKNTGKDRYETAYSETAVESLFQKMQKFNNCERILDRGLLQQEYYRQLTKKKQTKLKKQISK